MAIREETMTPQRRAMLAEKGRCLYQKYCGTKGRGICTEGFAVYHLRKGETETVLDLIDYLERQIARLEQTDPHDRLAMTRGLLTRIRQHLVAAAGQ